MSYRKIGDNIEEVVPEKVRTITVSQVREIKQDLRTMLEFHNEQIELHRNEKAALQERLEELNALIAD